MFSALTVTGDRPVQIETVIRCINRQVVKPDLWLITDDGKTPVDKSLLDAIKCEYKYIRLEPIEGHSLKRNFIEILERIPKDFDAVVIEDDDYYPKTYLMYMSAGLNRHDLLGVTNNRFYGLSYKRYMEVKPKHMSNLHATSFSYKILDTIKYATRMNYRESYSIDQRIWKDVVIRNKATVDLTPGNAQVSLKGWPCESRPGTMKEHLGLGGLTKEDNDLSVLKDWLKEDFDYYKKFVKE